MTLLWWSLSMVLVVNTSTLVVLLLKAGVGTCDWCHRRYWYRKSTSSFPFVFCSYRCNYWDMRDYLAKNMQVDIAEVDAYLNRHGWVHPDHIKEVVK